MPPLVAWEGRPYFTACWNFINSSISYQNNTIESQTSDGTAFTILNNASDFLYLGAEGRFDLAAFDLAGAGALGARTWQYSTTGNTWTTFAPGFGYDFAINGAETFDNLQDWVSMAFSATVPHAAVPPDTRERFWVRCSVASVTTAPTINRIYARPRSSYCTPTDVANLLQLATDFSTTTRPTRQSVEDSIYAAQAYIDKETRKSWRVQYKENEEHDFIRSGFKLIERFPFLVTRLQIWNGSSYDTKTSGRNSDYFLVPETGMVYFARFFILPARIQAYSGSAWGWGWGEFSFPVRISYLYGSNIQTNKEEGGLVFDIARKLTAIDIWQSHDYAILAASGSDKVSMERKIDNWKLEIEEKIAKLETWEIW